MKSTNKNMTRNESINESASHVTEQCQRRRMESNLGQACGLTRLPCLKNHTRVIAYQRHCSPITTEMNTSAWAGRGRGGGPRAALARGRRVGTGAGLARSIACDRAAATRPSIRSAGRHRPPVPTRGTAPGGRSGVRRGGGPGSRGATSGGPIYIGAMGYDGPRGS